MSLQRGNYGIEYDEREGFPLRKIWWFVFLILLPAAAALFFRGCNEPGDPEILDDSALGQTRYRLTTLEPNREPPARRSHFFWARKTSETTATQTNTTAASKSSSPTLKSTKNAAATPKPANLPSSGVRTLLQKVLEYEEADDLIAAQQLLQQLLLRRDVEEMRDFIERKLGLINMTLILDNRAMPGKKKHHVVAKNVISRLAKQYGTTQAYLLKANALYKPEALRLGHDIWVLDHPVFELTIFKRAQSAILTLNGLFFKRYETSFGNPDLIPVGTYAIRNRLENPSYQTSDNKTLAFGHPQNILGTRLLNLSATGATPAINGLGLHGTPRTANLKRATTNCRIRFNNTDIEELCLLMPDGATVNITD